MNEMNITVENFAKLQAWNQEVTGHFTTLVEVQGDTKLKSLDLMKIWYRNVKASGDIQGGERSCKCPPPAPSKHLISLSSQLLEKMKI